MKIITALLISLCAFATTAQAAPNFYCDAQVTNIHTGEKGAYIMDAGTLTSGGANIWFLSLNTEQGVMTQSFIADHRHDESLPAGYPKGAFHYETHPNDRAPGKYDGGTSYDFMIGSGEYKGTAILFVTPHDKSGNQMELTCKASK